MPIPSPVPSGTIHAGNPFQDSPFSATSGLRVKAKPAFFLCCDPDSTWDLAEEGLNESTWLPPLHPHALRPGSAGIRTLTKAEAEAGNRAAAYISAKEIRTSAGIIYLDPLLPVPAEFWPEIPPEYAVHVAATSGYEVRYPSLDPRRGVAGEHWTELWNVPQPTIGNRETRFAFDVAQFNRWRLWLVETGVIDPPQPHVIDEAKGIAAKRLERATTNPDPAIRAEKVAAAQGEVAKAAKAVIPEPTEDAPRARKGRKQGAARADT